MHLFLTSLASNTMDLLLPLLPKPATDLTLAYIPTAADPYPPDNRPWYDNNRQKIFDLGFNVYDYDIKGRTESQILTELALSDIIYVEGGNVFYLLSQMRQSGFDKALPKLLMMDKIYVGSSAGSAVLSISIEHAKLFDDPGVAPELVDYQGLGLIKTQLHPHSGKAKYADREHETRKQWGDKLTLLRDDQVMIVNGSKIEIVTMSSH